jgi:predicted secreted protein
VSYWVYEKDEEGDWQVVGVYSEHTDAASHALSVMLLHGDVMVKTNFTGELPDNMRT